MAKIILCRGIQGSGKTTWAKQWVLEDPEHRVRFNNDDIRNMLGKYWVPSREPIVTTMKNSFISGAAIFRMDVVIDNMNLNSKELDSMIDMFCTKITTEHPELPPFNMKETIDKLSSDEYIDNKIKNVLG